MDLFDKGEPYQNAPEEKIIWYTGISCEEFDLEELKKRSTSSYYGDINAVRQIFEEFYEVYDVHFEYYKSFSSWFNEDHDEYIYLMKFSKMGDTCHLKEIHLVAVLKAPDDLLKRN